MPPRYVAGRYTRWPLIAAARFDYCRHGCRHAAAMMLEALIVYATENITYVMPDSATPLVYAMFAV